MENLASAPKSFQQVDMGNGTLLLFRPYLFDICTGTKINIILTSKKTSVILDKCIRSDTMHVTVYVQVTQIFLGHRRLHNFTPIEIMNRQDQSVVLTSKNSIREMCATLGPYFSSSSRKKKKLVRETL